VENRIMMAAMDPANEAYNRGVWLTSSGRPVCQRREATSCDSAPSAQSRHSKRVLRPPMIRSNRCWKSERPLVSASRRTVARSSSSRSITPAACRSRSAAAIASSGSPSCSSAAICSGLRSRGRSNCTTASRTRSSTRAVGSAPSGNRLRAVIVDWLSRPARRAWVRIGISRTDAATRQPTAMASAQGRKSSTSRLRATSVNGRSAGGVTRPPPRAGSGRRWRRRGGWRRWHRRPGWRRRSR